MPLSGLSTRRPWKWLHYTSLQQLCPGTSQPPQPSPRSCDQSFLPQPWPWRGRWESLGYPWSLPAPTRRPLVPPPGPSLPTSPCATDSGTIMPGPRCVKRAEHSFAGCPVASWTAHRTAGAEIPQLLIDCRSGGSLGPPTSHRSSWMEPAQQADTDLVISPLSISAPGPWRQAWCHCRTPSWPCSSPIPMFATPGLEVSIPSCRHQCEGGPGWARRALGGTWKAGG